MPLDALFGLSRDGVLRKPTFRFLPVPPRFAHLFPFQGAQACPQHVARVAVPAERTRRATASRSSGVKETFMGLDAMMNPVWLNQQTLSMLAHLRAQGSILEQRVAWERELRHVCGQPRRDTDGETSRTPPEPIQY